VAEVNVLNFGTQDSRWLKSKKNLPRTVSLIEPERSAISGIIKRRFIGTDVGLTDSTTQVKP
jgi:hypothetical protein